MNRTLHGFQDELEKAAGRGIENIVGLLLAVPLVLGARYASGKLRERVEKMGPRASGALSGAGIGSLIQVLRHRGILPGAILGAAAGTARPEMSEAFKKIKDAAKQIT